LLLGKLFLGEFGILSLLGGVSGGPFGVFLSLFGSFGFFLGFDLLVLSFLDSIKLSLLGSLLGLDLGLFLSLCLLFDGFLFLCLLFSLLLCLLILLFLDFLGLEVSLLLGLFALFSGHESFLLLLIFLLGNLFGIAFLGGDHLSVNLLFGDLIWGQLGVLRLGLDVSWLLNVEITHFGNQVLGLLVGIFDWGRWLHPNVLRLIILIIF